MTTLNRTWDVGLRDKVAIVAGGSRDPAMVEGLRRYAAGDRPPPPRPPA